VGATVEGAADGVVLDTILEEQLGEYVGLDVDGTMVIRVIGNADGILEGIQTVGMHEGLVEGSLEVGFEVNDIVGIRVFVGFAVSATVGTRVEEMLGLLVGNADGFFVGLFESRRVGNFEGRLVDEATARYDLSISC